jgi:hypothetical protein
MKNKYLHLAILSILLFKIAPQLYSQVPNLIEFDGNSFVNSNEPIPYGEKIIITGNSEAEIIAVDVEIIYGLNTQEIKAGVNGSHWSAIVGPFPARSNVIFIIKERKKISPTEMEKITFDIINSINESSDTIISRFKEVKKDSLVLFYINNLEKAMRNEMSSYFSTHGTPALNGILNEIKLVLTDSFPKINSLREINKIVEDDFYQIAFNNKDDLPYINKTDTNKINFAYKLSSLDTVEVDSINKVIAALDSTLTPKLLNILYMQFITKYHAYKTAKTEIEGIIRKKSANILKESISVSSIPTSKEVLGVESYIGIDLGLTYIDKLSATSFFATLSPYLSKTDPEKDYKFTCNSLLHFITPTVGIGIGNDSKGIKPIYLAGIGIRLNKITRITVGGVYYTEPEQEKYTWSLGFTASINVNYVSDLLRKMTAAQSGLNQ